MKQKRPAVLSVLSWIHTLLLFWCVYPFLVSLSSYGDEDFGRAVASGMLLLIPILTGWVLLPHVKHYQLYLTVGILISAGTGTLASRAGGTTLMELPLCGLLTGVLSFLVFLIHAMAKRHYGQMKQEFLALHHEEDFPMRERDMPNFLNHPHPAHLAFPTILYYLAILMDRRECLPVIFAMVAVDVPVLALYLYGDHFYEYKRRKQSTANLPLGTMRRIHRFSGAAGLVLLLLFLLPSILYGREITIHTDSSDSLIEWEPVEQTVNERRSAVSQSDQMEELLASGNASVVLPDWLGSLMELIAYVAFAAAIVLVIISILKALKRFQRDFAVEEDDEVINLDEESEGLVTRVLRRTRTEGSLTPNRVIRRRYRRAIRRSLKSAPKHWGTPTEIEREAALDTDADMQKLHGYYEKARYSREGCTQEDVHSLV